MREYDTSVLKVMKIKTWNGENLFIVYKKTILSR